MSYIGKKDEKITRVYTERDTEHISMHIVSNHDTYSFYIDNHSQCCEGFSVGLIDNEEVVFIISANEDATPENDYNLLDGYYINIIEYCHERSFYPKNYDGLHILSYKLTLKDKKLSDFVYYINITNDHSSYYPHNYIVEWKNYNNEGEL